MTAYFLRLRRKNKLIYLPILLLLAGCNLAPPYQRPPVNIPATYKETGAWLRAEPGRASIERGPWWQMFDDPILNALEIQVETANPSLQAALARYDEARAAVQVARGRLFSHNSWRGKSRSDTNIADCRKSANPYPVCRFITWRQSHV